MTGFMFSPPQSSGKIVRQNLRKKAHRYIIGKHSFGLPVIHLLYPVGWTPAGIFMP